jgi:PAS domain S-box-containing protein
MRSRFFRPVAFAVAFSVGATGLRYIGNPELGVRSPFLFHVFAVAIAAQYFGTLCGLITTALSVVLIDYYFIPPLHTLGPPPTPVDNVALLLFTIVGIALSLFGGRRKRADQQLRETAQALQDANQRLALRHEVARIGSFEWFIAENRVELSPEMEKLCGLESGAVLTIEQWKGMLDPDDVDGASAAIEDTIRRRQPTCDVTFRVHRPDGAIVWVHSRCRYDYDAGGQAVHVLAVCMDVTELKRGEMAQQILGGFLQVCSACRRIQDSKSNEWYSMEGYLRLHSTARFSHGMCPDCSKQWYPEKTNPS